MRTSENYPLQIAALPAGSGMGTVGVTFCPGKTNWHASTGAWGRDLTADLQTIHDWDAAAVVTLMESFELDELRVPDLGDRVQDQHMEWVHLPIRDMSTPDTSAEATWNYAVEGLRDLIRSGGNALLHCRGGLGRSGMMTARLLVELGWNPDKAIQEVRHVRPGAIETDEQLSVVRQAMAIPAPNPSTSDEAIQDRARGWLIGPRAS